MKTRILMALLALPLVGLLTGCGDSLAQTGQERANNWRKIQQAEFGMALDDLDAFLLADRRSRLSKWH